MSSIATDRADPEAAVGAALVQAASLTADTVLPPLEPAATFTPAPRPTAPRQSGFAATLSHIRYVLSENPVTGFAFALFLLGGLAGVAAGFYGGWTDRIVGRLADTIMAFPLFVLAMGIVAAMGNTVQNIVLATAIVNFPLYAR